MKYPDCIGVAAGIQSEIGSEVPRAAQVATKVDLLRARDHALMPPARLAGDIELKAAKAAARACVTAAPATESGGSVDV